MRIVPFMSLVPRMSAGIVSLVVGLVVGTGCANDPVYIPGTTSLEAGIRDEMNGLRSEATSTLQLPIKTESAGDASARERLAAELDPIEVPYVRVGDLEIEVEWTIKNLDAADGDVTIELNGANEFFAYNPAAIVLDPEDEDPPPTPGLAGDIPITVRGGATISGLFTEDDLREAAIDLDQVTRGNVNPFRASLTISKNAPAFQPLTPPNPMPAEGDGPYDGQMPDGPEIPRAAFAGLVRIDLVFRATAHMVLDYNIRIRDVRGIMHDLLLTAETEAPDELQQFMPVDYTPTPVAP